MAARFGEWMESLSGNARGGVFMIGATLSFAFMVSMIKLAGQSLGVTQILLVRQAIMVVIVAPAIIKGFPGVLRTNNLGLQFLRVAAALGAMLAGFTAVIHMELAEATALAFSKSFFVTIFAIFILGEIVGVRRWAALSVGFVGVLIMVRPGSADFTIYSLMMVGSAMGAGLVMVLIRKMSRTDSPTTILSYQAVFVGIAVAIPGVLTWINPTLREWMLLLGIGVVSYIGQMLNIYAHKFGEASVMAILDYMRLIFATILGFMLFAELPDGTTLIGALVVVGAALYTVRRETLRKSQAAEIKGTRPTEF